MNTATKSIGFVGVGAMGAGMCRNLVEKSGLPVLVADVNEDNLRQAVESGARAATVPEMAMLTDTVFLSLPTIDHVEEVCFGKQPLIVPGGRVRTVVDMSTSDVVRTRKLAERLREAGIKFLDAPVGRSREAANKGTLLITVGGPKELFEECLPLFQCMGTDIVLCGDIGTGQVIKILNNMVLLSTVNALSEAMAIAEQSGVEKAKLVSAFSLGAANSFGLQLTGEKYLAKDEFPEKLFPASYALKDLRLALELAAAAEVDAAIAKSTASLLERSVSEGYGANHYPVMYRLVRKQSVASPAVA